MDRKDFLRILEEQGTPEHVKRHCMAVGDASVNICTALVEAGMTGLDADAVMIAGYLHDIARAGKDHDAVGARRLKEMGLETLCVSAKSRDAAVDIVARHMKLIFPEKLEAMDSADIVSLADRTVKEDVYVGYEMRMDDLLRRYHNIPEVVERVHENTSRALVLITQIEDLTAKPFEEIVTGGRLNISRLLAGVERPGRYIGGETGSIAKGWNDVKFRFCFAFPDLYEIGMSYTGMQIIYGALNSRKDTLCERVFAPAEDMANALAEHSLPLFSLENHMPVGRFDVVGFTLQYELCYSNVVRMLKQAGIPLYAADRREGDPFVIAGGPCCVNAEPVAPFLDLVCVGDGEEVLHEIADAYIHWKGQMGQKGREGFLLACSGITGVYVPSFYRPVYKQAIEGPPSFSHYEKKYESLNSSISRAVVADLDASFFPEKPLVSHIESVHDRFAVEIMRGCYRKCKFCQASFACDGVRKRSPERIKELVFSGLSNTGYDEVTLLSLSTGDYPGIEGLVTDLMDELSGMDAVLSMPSMRLDSLKEGTLAKIAAYKHSGLTFAPEAGSQRLRDLIGKQLTEEDILRAMEICLPLGFGKFKFYFMIGLPGETYEDLDSIAALAGKVIRHAKSLAIETGKKYHFSLSVSVSNFVPKPGTPFESEAGDSEEELIAKIHYLKDAIRKTKGAAFKYHDTRMSRIEMLLAKGDRRVSEVVRLAAERGSGFDSWREHFDYDNWLGAFADAGLPAEDLYSVNREGTDEGACMPWSIIAPGKAYE